MEHIGLPHSEYILKQKGMLTLFSDREKHSFYNIIKIEASYYNSYISKI